MPMTEGGLALRQNKQRIPHIPTKDDDRDNKEDEEEVDHQGG